MMGNDANKMIVLFANAFSNAVRQITYDPVTDNAVLAQPDSQALSVEA